MALNDRIGKHVAKTMPKNGYRKDKGISLKGLLSQC